MKNKKGFTLVELLAVIVVLAIIMIIAVPAVLDSMSNAKQGSLKVEARKVLSKALEKRQAAELTNDQNVLSKTCFDLSELVETGSTYKGKVVYTSGEWYVYISDGTNLIKNKKSSQIENSVNATGETWTKATETKQNDEGCKN